MKDAMGHGSNNRGGPTPQSPGMKLARTHTFGPHSANVYQNPAGEIVVKTFRDGQYQPDKDIHTWAMGDANTNAQQQLQRWGRGEVSGDVVSRSADEAAAALHSGTSKSEPAPVHSAMKDIYP